ncbi:MAG TPA: hypothetical protein VM577_15365 [Anaerovoracaceae bacterium]|nr:hypothetical protein [Anaerovoracaceae bacterium]
MNLVIGSTSQLAQYFPEDYIKISSRNIDFDYLKNNQWDSVYITFAEQRIYDPDIDYLTPNYFYTRQIAESLLENSKKIVCYTSCELWNTLTGFIRLDTLPQFSPIVNEYTISKMLLWHKLKVMRYSNPLYNKIVLAHPFYFNSTYRSEYFLFGKIFKSIINKEKIEVGNLDFYRDMVHTKFVVEKSIGATKDIMIGSGKLFHIRTFVKDLYKLNDMNFSDYVKDHSNLPMKKQDKLIMADVPWDYTYEDLLKDTQEDLKQAMEKRWIR